MRKRCIALGILLAGQAWAAGAADLSVRITNLTHGIWLTPLLVAAHGKAVTVFEPGEPASASLQLMAECGDISDLVSDLNAAGADLAPDPAGGLLAPGANTTAQLSTADHNRRLSVVAMLLPTNDGFAGLHGERIPLLPGTHTFYANGYDAGTEANDELLDTSGCAPGMPGIPADPGGGAGTGGSGVTATEANTEVHVHRGNLGDTNPTGGTSDLDPTIHRWQNPVLEIQVRVN